MLSFLRQHNLRGLLPLVKVTEGTKQDIINFVNAGNGVVIHEESITVDGWIGMGYIATDSTTGAGAYRITGGDNGGAIMTGVLLKAKLKKALKIGLAGIIALLLPKDPCEPGSLVLSVIAITIVFGAILALLNSNPVLAAAAKGLNVRKAMSEALIATFVMTSATNAMADDGEGDDCETKCDPEPDTLCWSYDHEGAAHPTRPDGQKRTPHYHTWKHNLAKAKKRCFWNKRLDAEFTYSPEFDENVELMMKPCYYYESWWNVHGRRNRGS